MEVRGIGSREQRHGRRRHKRMPVRVNQARHQHPTALCDNADVGVSVNGNRSYRYAFDNVSSDENIGGGRQSGALAIEDADVLKERCALATRGDLRF
jgi:hypothetical protein